MTPTGWNKHCLLFLLLFLTPSWLVIKQPQINLVCQFSLSNRQTTLKMITQPAHLTELGSFLKIHFYYSVFGFIVPLFEFICRIRMLHILTDILRLARILDTALLIEKASLLFNLQRKCHGHNLSGPNLAWSY